LWFPEEKQEQAEKLSRLQVRSFANLYINSSVVLVFSALNSLPDQQQPKEASGPDAGQIPRWKSALDICLILLALPLLVPLMLAIAAFIRIVSPGPILFKQERVGLLGRRFKCFKFRSMAVGADTTAHRGHLKRLMESNTPMQKMDAQGDPRVIAFGSLLRASGLDELPQLINVLRGEMSLVGPRPCLPYEFEGYLPWQRERFNTLPGLTGLWQVSGKNRTTFVEMIQLDIHYGKSRTLGLDLAIILKTLPALITQMQESRKRKKLLAPLQHPKPAAATGSEKQLAVREPVFTAVTESRRDS
jgi:lipopolysaccharide/colanic/teichoic acid biosynthesis glycosyltransferase